MTQKQSPKESRKSDPLVTIITVVFNGVHGIEDTITSVKEHFSNEIEYIIVDGGSNDGTVELIKKNDECIDKWISEPDNGIYDALNKGIKISRGHFFYVLNVGDKLINFPRTELLEARRQNADVVLFKVLFSDGRTFQSTIDYRTRFGNTVHHQGAFYRRDLNIVYDTAYKVYSDFDVNQKLFLQNKKFMSFDKVISRHSLDGVSSEGKYFGEYLSVIRKNFGMFWSIIGFLYVRQGELRMQVKEWFSSESKISGK